MLLDGCGDRLARENLGFLEHLAEDGRGARYSVRGQLPSLSRPLYETLLTGVPVRAHGIVANATARLSKEKSVFSLAREQGLTTAAAAYHWVSELYNSSPFDPMAHRIQHNSGSAIQNGVFYYEDPYPDSHVLSDAEYLRRTYDPDFLMIHTMAIDHTGHVYGGGSRQQNTAANFLDAALAPLVALWLEEGYRLIITADHGMGANGLHGGNSPEQRDVPLYVFSGSVRPGIFDYSQISQLTVAPLLCAFLGIAPSAAMRPLSECEVDFLA